VRALLAPLHDEPTAVAVEAERAFLKELEGGCQVPIAGHAQVEDGTVELHGMVAAIEGGEMIRRHGRARLEDAAPLGRRIAREILAAGGDRILREAYGQSSSNMPGSADP
jgi:hydroxymethylbilane synthase